VSGSLYRSNVDRSEKERRVLKEHGEQIAVMKLQGFIFFGTANNLLARVRRRVEDADTAPLRYLLLDFRAVDGIDSSAVMSFVRMKQLAYRMNFIMGLVGLTDRMRDQLESGGCCLEDDPLCYYFEDLDRGLERCENILLAWSSEDVHLKDEALPERLEREFRSVEAAATFLGYLEKLDKGPGHTLMRQRDESDDLYFLELGKVTANLEIGEGKVMRLRTMGPGTVVGEIGFYLNGPRTASVITETEATLYRLTRAAMERMEQDSPEAASAFHEFMVRLLAERLAETNKMLQVILD
jgi:SulP family sulfate permease